jgi:anthranilate synthase/aminodeoxychorismate synthase-like glutamine amidotransferase
MERRAGANPAPSVAVRAGFCSPLAVILVIDNRDSFTWNLVQYLMELGQEVRVERADDLDASRARELRPERLLIGPGPGGPEQARSALSLVRALAGEVPMLGVCLGLQVITVAFGGSVERAPEPVHGHAHRILHGGRGLFRGLPSPLTVGRYHSLAADELRLPRELRVTARTEDGVVMALAHRSLPIEAVQFHPESILSEAGHALLANFCSG